MKINESLGADRGVWIVRKFPSVADVLVIRDGHHDASLVVVDASPVRALPAFAAIFATLI
jgi:hypothetical protein